MRIAIVSTDNTTVNDHFGRATRFLIWDLGAAGPSFVEERPAPSLSTGDKGHTFDQSRFDKVLATLVDCKKVYCTKIGDRPAGELNKAGIEPVLYDGPIAAIR
ncbi:MAG: hypothetical protein OEV91_11285 [Desulfobulbaceae bacterium]|nr:hypothetical protein [Desulfobulbaceae bacterium]